jgi:hypothetical protein
MIRISQCLDNRLTDDGEIVSLANRPRSTLQKHILILLYVRSSVNPRAVVRLEVLDKLKKFIDFTGTFRLVAKCLNQLCYKVASPYRQVK